MRPRPRPGNPVAATLGAPEPSAEFHGTYLTRKEARKVSRKYEDPRLKKITTGQNKKHWTVITGPTLKEARPHRA
jgi:hypothetical protein